MKKSLIRLSFVSLFFISQHALSDELKKDTDNFKGLNLGLGLSAVKYDSDYNIPGFPDYIQQFRSTNMVPRFDGSYSFALNDKWLLGIGLTVDLSPFNSKPNFPNPRGDHDNINYETLTSRTSNHFSLYVEPTYVIDSSLAVFGKLSYQSSNITNIDTCYGDVVGCSNDHMRLDGMGVGLGIKKMINQNIYVQLEGEYVDYSHKNFIDIYDDHYSYFNNNSYSGTLSVGYHF